MFKKVRGAGDNSSFLSRLTGLRRRRLSSSKSRSILRRLLNEQLEPRQLLAADIHGDTLATAMQLSLQANQQTEIQATIGDGDYGAKDVDLYRVHLAVGQTLQVDIDAGLTDAGNMLSSLDSFLRVLNSSGVELAINSSGKAPNDYSYGGYVGYGGYGPSPDSFLTFQAPASGDYYIGVSGESYDYYYGGASGNRTYNPNLPNSGVSSSTGNYVLQLVTDTPPTPKLSIANVTVLESSGTASVTVSLSPASSAAVSVNYATANGSASSGTDYTSTSGMLSFAPGETSKTIVIAILNDNVSELYETFQVLLSSAVGADLLVSTSSVTIKNDDSDAAGDRIADAQSVSLVPEAQSQIDAMIGDGLYNNKDVDFYRVELSAGQELSIDLDAAFADNGSVLSTLDGRIRVFDSTGLELTPGDVYRSGQGSSPNDFEDPNGTTSNYSDDFFVFTPALPGVYYIGVSSESNNSYDPTVVNSGYGNNASSSVGAYRLQLFSSMPPVPTLHVTQRDFDEADGTSTIKVTLDYPSAQTITVDYAALPGTATSPADYSLASGTLTFVPGTVEKTIQISVTDDTALGGNERFQLVLSNAVNAPIAASNTEFVIVDNEPNPIQYVRLVRDTGYDRHDLRTVNPELEGRVEGNLRSGSARVEFDHDEDGVVDGFVNLTSSPSDFVYDPRMSDTSLVDFVGTVPMRYRFAMTESNGTLIETSWEAFSYVLEEVPASAYVVTELSHSAGQTDTNLPGPSVSSGMQITGHVIAFETYYGDGYGGSSSSGGCDGPMGPFPEGGGPTGEPNGDFGNPNLGSGCGPSSGGDSVEGTDPPNLPLAIPVEIDLDMDGEVDVTTTTNTDQDFSKYFASFDSGYHTIQARALEWNEDYGMNLTGAWASYSFYWENASAPNVISLGLLNDTGYSDSDLNTADPRIVGELEQPFHNVTDVEIDFDLNGDGIVDGQSSIDENAKFQFTPVGLAAGWRTIRVRSSAWDNDAAAVIKGTWQSLGIYYDPIPLPEIQALALLVDDGASSSDKVTTNATLIGNVTQSDSDDLRLYFDFDQDGVADTTMTPQEDGQFLYNALELQPGAYTIDVWATRFSSIFGQTEIGPTQSFSFTLVAKPQSPLSVVDLALVADTGINKTDFVTSNPAIKGRLSGEGSVSRLTVEIDVNADGVVDATTTADTAGNFQFSPVGLALGPHAISARGVSYNYAAAALLKGAWESISFSLVASTNEAAIISEFGLVNDSGTPGDNHSEDARLSGGVLNDSSAVVVAVEFDVNGDGIPEQTVFSGPDGRFIIDPQLSMYGAVTVSARAVEYDSEAAATISGPWTNFSFVYENQADAAPVTSDLLFDSGDVASGEQPSLSGKARYQHSNAGLRVEIDANGDGTSDYTAITDVYGQFQVQLPNLANNTASIDIRSIGTNPNTKAIQSETWRELSINYVIASSAAATIVNLALAEDTGSSSTDRVTTNPKITGGVSRKPTGRVMIVEVDTDGDNTANGTTIVGADLKWTYSPANLAVGSVTVSARTRDTAVDGQTVYGAWSNFTFTLQSSVNSGGSSEEQDQQGAIGDANNQADADRNAADGDLSDAISSANQAQDASVTAAENQFNADLAQAANAFAQAQATAAANYQAALAAFAGNNTTFNFDPLEWPDSPQLDRFTVPDDSILPQPPRDKPDYQGPAFDFNSSGTYLAANNLAKSAYNTAIANASSARRTQDQTALETYRNAINAENDRASNARQAAQDAYQTVINSPASTDLAAARDTYNNAMQSATDTYWSSVDNANSARNSAIQSASSSAQSSYESAWNSFDSTATSAWNSLMSVLNSNPAPSQSAREAAWNSYSSTMLAAGKTRDQANADTSHAFSDAAITANTAWYKALADAQQTLSLAQNSAAKTYDDAVANHDNELRGIKIAATITLEKALATIARDTAKNNANAVQTRDKQLATNAKIEQLAIAGAKSTLWTAQATAKKFALVAWNAAFGSPWTAYQVELTNNELSYFQSLSTAHNTHSQAVADAEKVRADAVADAARQRVHDTADEKRTLAHGYSDAKSTYWTNSATELHTATLDSNSERQTIRDELANIAHARAHQSADDGETYARTMNDAGHDYATTMISARTLQGVPAGTAISAGATYAIARNNAGRTLALANIANNQTWSTDYRTAWDNYSDNTQSASTTQSNEIAGDLKQFHETVAPLDRDYAIAMSEIEGDESQAIAAASVIYVQAVAPVDKAFEIASVQYVGIRQLGDANDLKSYRVAEATSYSSQMNAWHSGINSPWSAMYVNQGSIEIAWANATGTAEVAFATAVKAANLTRETTQAEAKRLRRISIATADQTRTNSIADQKDVYVGAVAAAKYTYAMTLAGVSLSQTENNNNDSSDQNDDNRTWSNSHFADSAADETAYQIAMINANTDYANASTSASAAFSSAVAASWQTYSDEVNDSWESYNDGDISYETHQSNVAASWSTHQGNVDDATDTYNSDMTSATDAYNTAAKGAWEALRDARAESMGEYHAHMSSGTRFYAHAQSVTTQTYLTDKGAAEKLLADAILAAKTTLANSNGATEKTYVNTIAPLDAAYEVTLRQSDNAHSYASTTASTTKNRDIFIADGARREDQIAARGIYETASYQAFATVKVSIAAANPNPRTLAEADAAAADALWANAVRIARDSYEDAISIAGLSRINFINAAEVARTGSLNVATYNYTNSVAWAESAYQIAVSHASTNLSVIDAIGQATVEKQETYARIDYDIAAADAKVVLNHALSDLADTYAGDVGDAYEQYYLDAAGEWTDITWTNVSSGYYGWGYYGYYGWGGYYGYGGYYGDYYGYGYGYGGYYGGYYGGFGYGWGGWGLGYYWGYGFGGLGGWSSDAYSDLQDSLEASDDVFNADAIAAHVTYATAIGDADITRATTIGDAKVALADARGNGGVLYATAINTAESNRSTATLTAAATQATAIANANKTYADVLSAANRDKTVAAESAEVGLVNLEQTANVVREGNLTTAEANFQISTANAQAAFASAVASGSGNPAAIYAATYAQAKANWIVDVAPAFITHATTVATADGQAAYNIALARGTRNVTKANADKTFADVQSTQVKTRALGEIAPTNTQLSGLLGLQNARRLSAANHTKTYEHDFATAEKELGIDNAEASKQREIDRANKVESETYEDTYNAAIGDGKLTYETTIADAKLTWQQDEATHQQTFTNSSIPINHAFSTAIIGLYQTYAVAVTNAEETRQYAHATAEGTFFVAQTTANNIKRTSTANAVIGLWNVQESARVAAHIDIDNVLQIPWSQYLVDAATARAAWWNGASAQYANLATDRNTAETTYTGRLAIAHVTRQKSIATATKNKSLVEANTQAAEATAKANAVRDYFTAMVTPTKTYVDMIAQAERQKSVATAQAHRDYIDHESSSQRTADLNAANNAFTSTKNAQDSTYRSALASEQADQYFDFATAEFNRTVALIAAEVSLVTIRNNAENTYRNEESDAYLQSATSWANIDAFYRQYEANSFASAASSLASSTGTPWAAYDADFYAAQTANVTAVSNAAKTNAIAQATAQKTAEVAQTNAETTWRNAYATASSVLNTGIAGAHLGFATAQSLIYSAMGGSNLPLPTVSRPTDLAGEYTVPGPGNTYRTSISSVTSTNYYYGWWGGYWWGAWGYYGSGYWYSGYGGYYGYLYGSQVSSAASVTLQEPQKQFPGSFWQIDASTANDPWEALEVQYRYGNANSEALVAQVELPEGSFTRLPTVDTKISSGMKSINVEVIDLMQELGDTAGDLWTLIGSINLAPLAKRISSDLAELAPELTQNELQQQSDSYSSSYAEQPVGDTSLASGAISVSPAADQSSSAVALQLVSENGELSDEAATLTREELEKAKQIAVETFAQQMLLKAAENSSAEIVQVILDQYKDNADLQNALIMMLQSYKVVTADAWWSDYWIDHETRTVYVSSKNNYYTRDATSIVGELSEAIRDDSQFYQMFGLDESWEGFSSRIGFGLLEAVGGGFTIAGGVFLAVAPEPTMVTKAGAVVAFGAGGNSVVAGLSSAWGRESRVDIIGSGLEKYYDVTGVDQDLRWIGRGGLLMSNLAIGFVGPTTKWSSIRAFLSNSKAFVQQSLTRFQELLHSGKSIREIAKIDDIAALMARSKAALEEFTANRHWRAPTGALLKKVWNAEYRELRRAFEGSVEWLDSVEAPIHPITKKPSFGSYDPIRNRITLFKGADDTTFFHELLHWKDVQMRMQKYAWTREKLQSIWSNESLKQFFILEGEKQVGKWMLEWGFTPIK